MDRLSEIYRRESGKMIAALMRQYADLQLAEDALQEAFLQAQQSWALAAQDSWPENPAAWLYTAARRRQIDRLRKQSLQDNCLEVEQHNALEPEPCIELDAQGFKDDRLRLIFTCCHPALSEEARLALTLKTVCGLNSREIARAFLSSEASINKRLSRAKQKIKTAAIPYTIPEAKHLQNYLPSVLSIIYLIYNESYSAYAGQSLSRQDLADESVRLARLLCQQLPEPETAGLLALILLHEARKPARSNDDGSFVPLQYQNRKLWRKDLIQEGNALVMAALAQAKLGPYQLQAAISALHCHARDWQCTDWLQIFQLYQQLEKFQAGPVVMLNKFVALAYSGSLHQAFEKILELETDLQNYQPYYAAKANLARDLGDKGLARSAYQKAISLSQNAVEINFLQGQLKHL